MIDTSLEAENWRLEWIFGGKVELELESTALQPVSLVLSWETTTEFRTA